MTDAHTDGPVSAGRMRHRGVLEAATLAADGSGGHIAAWQPVADVWVAIEPVSAAERVRADRLQHGISHRLAMRYRAGVTAGQRIRARGRTFRIHGAVNWRERDRFLLLDCEEVDTP